MDDYHPVTILFDQEIESDQKPGLRSYLNLSSSWCLRFAAQGVVPFVLSFKCHSRALCLAYSFEIL